jgi:hypothetical protein
MKLFAYLSASVFVIASCQKPNTEGQRPTAPNISWSKSFGGTGHDKAQSVVATPDGGYVLVGYTFSNDGDFNGNKGGSDAFVIKVDGSGEKQWVKLFGGSSDDFAQTIIKTNDGGYIMVGTSRSHDGDVSGTNYDYDAWILKIDAGGNKQWSKVYGGTDADYGISIAKAADGGYVMAGYTLSVKGDFSANQGTADIWVLKTDGNGEKQWSKLFGGSGYDVTQSVTPAPDGGYLLSGYTWGNNGDFTGNHGQSDGWVMKIDDTGNKQWSKLLGGSGLDAASSIIYNGAGGFIMTGTTVGYNNSSDAWLMKLNASGDTLWSKTLGGASAETSNAIAKATDGSYVLTGNTTSYDGDYSKNHGGDGDLIVMKTDSIGNKKWVKVLGGSKDEIGNSIITTADGGIVIAGYTGSQDGDVGSNKGGYDAWLIKLK